MVGYCKLAVSLLVVVTTYVGLAACGRVEPATPQKNPKLEATALRPQAEPFNLSAASSPAHYAGSLLIWNPNATPPLIAAVSTQTVETRLAQAAHQDYVRRTVKALRDDKLKKQAAVEAATATINAAEEQQRSAQRPAAEAWWSEQLQQLQGRGLITAAEAAAATENFNRYCEYKIWELAMNPLLQQKLPQRPTPLAMCEPYYEAQGYLSRASNYCADAATPSGQDYFLCLWEEGVLRTKIAPWGDTTCGGTGALANARRVDAIRGWLHDGQVFRQALFDPQRPVATIERSFGEMFRDDYLMQGRSFTPDAFSAGNQTLMACRKAFKRTDEGLSELKRLGESEDPSSGHLASTGNAAKDAQLWEALNRPLLYFAARIGAKVSINDRMFNQAIGVTLETWAAYEQEFATSHAFATLKDLAQAPPALLQARRARQTELLQVSKKLAAAETQSQQLLTAVTQANAASVRASGAAGAALLVNSLVLTVKRQIAQLDVRLAFGGGLIELVGCAPLIAKTCQMQVAPGTASLETVAFDADTGALHLEVVLSNPRRLGLAPLARGSAYFNDFSLDQLRQRILSLDFYPDHLGQTLAFITGKAFIKNQDRVEFEGSLSGADYRPEFD